MPFAGTLTRRSRCYEEDFLGLDELAETIINPLELGHRRVS